jgi:hypothetical protein
MAKRSQADRPAAEPRTISRSWFVALIALVVLPWLVVLAIYMWPRWPAPVARGTAATLDPIPSPAAIGSGPWGDLFAMPIVISPPLEQVPSNWGPVEPLEWRFPQSSPADVERLLEDAGVSDADATRLVRTAAADPRIAGLVVRPDPAFVWSLPSNVRGRLYGTLAQSPLNPRQHDAYRYAGSSVEEWLGASLISPDTLQLVKPLVYREGDFLFFADIDLVRPRIHDPEELQRLAKGLFRVSTMIVEVRVKSASEVDALSEYWGRGGRRTDIQPLLESIVGSGPHDQIDITHLLPPVARLNLYRYPKVTLDDLQRSSLVNCLWTALNFFNPEPDDRMADLAAATTRLRRDYYLVQDRFQLGDIVALTDSQGNLFHVAVYLAANLVFTKNGMSPLSPWVIMPMERLKGYYIQYGESTGIQYYRRKDM